MKALSIRQPWAHWIIFGHPTDGLKDVENRTWSTTYRGWVAVHAGKQPDKGHLDDITEDMEFGGFIGFVKLDDVVEDSDSGWAMDDCFHWQVESPQPIEFTPYAGKLGLFNIPDDLVPAPCK